MLGRIMKQHGLASGSWASAESRSDGWEKTAPNRAIRFVGRRVRFV